jgi:hypothetical protein
MPLFEAHIKKADGKWELWAEGDSLSDLNSRLTVALARWPHKYVSGMVERVVGNPSFGRAVVASIKTNS